MIVFTVKFDKFHSVFPFSFQKTNDIIKLC